MAAESNNGANNAEKEFLREQEEARKEIEKLDMTNPIMLLDKIPSYSNTNEHVFFEILNKLVKLSESEQDAFVRYPELLYTFIYIINNSFFEFENMEKELIRILKNISQTPEHVAILKMKLDQHDPASPLTNILRGLFLSSGILPIFNMPEIMASNGEPPHVYAMQGHGCVYDKRPPIDVPKGVIWIEMTVCGLPAFSSDIRQFINLETKRFLENTPIPTDEPSRQKYRADLGALTDYGVGVKFPGQPIADGTNTLFFQAFTDGIPQNRFYKSGIERLYTKPLNIDEYTILSGTVEEGNDRFFAPYSKIYADSIYPTLDQVIRNEPTQTNYVITFHDLFAEIESQEYEVTKPMILIQAGCRTPCDGVIAPALRKQNSENGKTKMVSELPIHELLRPGREGQNYLTSLIKQKLFGQARLLMERVERELGPAALSHYLVTEHILESIRYEEEPFIIDHKAYVVPKEFKDLVQSKISESDIGRRFRKIRHYLNSESTEWEGGLAFTFIVDLAEPQKEEFIAYEGLFDTLLKLLDTKSQRASIRYLIGKLAVTDEDKARLASKFAAIPAAEGVRGESIAELRQILKDHGVIAAGGTRKKRRRANKKSRRVVRNRGIKKRC